MTVPILTAPPEHWYCPNCKCEEIIPAVVGPHTRFHTCPALRMLTAPMIPAGMRAKVVAHEREDYEGADTGHTQLDADGRPIMSVETIREEGNDLLVYAPTATATADSVGIRPSLIVGAATASASASAHGG